MYTERQNQIFNKIWGFIREGTYYAASVVLAKSSSYLYFDDFQRMDRLLVSLNEEVMTKVHIFPACHGKTRIHTSFSKAHGHIR